MKALICTNFKKEKSIKALPELIYALNECGIQAIISEKASEFFSSDAITYTDEASAMKECDVFITLGGDGTSRIVAMSFCEPRSW